MKIPAMLCVMSQIHVSFHDRLLSPATCSDGNCIHLQADEVLEQPSVRGNGRRLQRVLQGAVVMMALVAVASAFSPGPSSDPVLLQQAAPSATPNITKVVGPSERQWMAWENAHGMPKECTPVKEESKGPHGEDVFTYYADCSMLAKDHSAVLKAAKAAAHKAQGAIALASKANKVAAVAKTTAAAAHATPALGLADRKSAAKKALATKAKTALKAVKSTTKSGSDGKDLEPPALPSMLQKPRPKKVQVKPKKVVHITAAMMGVKQSNKPETLQQKLRRVFFDNQVKHEEAKLIASDQARAAALIVDPDAEVANGQWGSAAKAKPLPPVAKLASKAKGPAAAILEMIGGSDDLE